MIRDDSSDSRTSTPFPAAMISGLRQLLHNRSGALTRDLLLHPSQHGLPQLTERHQADTVIKTVCGYCSTGCSLNAHIQNGQAVSLSPATEYPVNLGMACPKGWQALDALDAPDRAMTPLARSQRDQSFEPLSWPSAMSVFCDRFKRIQQQYGHESVAFLSTGQIPSEEMAFLGSLAKFGMNIRHGDGNTRQCMATSVVAYKESFGFDAPPFTYADFEVSDVLVFIGANPCIAHPILWERVTRNRRQPQIIVIDPRLTETAAQATQHLQLRPKSDLTLLYGLARILIANDWIDHAFLQQHTSGFEDFSSFVQTFTTDRVCQCTGLSELQLQQLATTIHQGQCVSFWWTMGVNQSYEGVRTAQAIINLALMTGNIGRPGTGANSITGQCNAMGSRLFSNTTGLLAGRDFRNAEHRQQVADILSFPVETIPQDNSWAYNEVIEGIRSGAIRGLWIIATNTAHSWIHQNDVRELLGRLDFLVVQDMYHSTETAQMADLILPAAGWGEKDGTFINSERRIGVTRAVRRAPGIALSDFRIFRLIASAWGCEDLFKDWTSPEHVFQKLKQLSAGQPCDFSGIRDYAMLDQFGGIQWPCTVEQAIELTDAASAHHPISDKPPENPNERRLFADGQFFHVDQRARFVFEQPSAFVEPADRQFPLILLTGRGTAAQWHTQTRTGKSAILRTLYPSHAYLEINRQDADRLAIRTGDDVVVSSRRGRITLRAVVSPTVSPGQVFAPMHYESVNQLTQPVFDPCSKQPSYKACAVNVERSDSCHPRNHTRHGAGRI